MMLLLRALVLLMLGTSLGCFAAYGITGRLRFRILGVRVLASTLVAGLLFFAVLFFERVVMFP